VVSVEELSVKDPGDGVEALDVRTVLVQEHETLEEQFQVLLASLDLEQRVEVFAPLYVYSDLLELFLGQ
jgi:hypothetical protein